MCARPHAQACEEERVPARKGERYIPDPLKHAANKIAENRAFFERNLGQRVGVQYRGSRGPADLVGRVESLGSATVLIRTDPGRPHQIDLASIIATTEKMPHEQPQGKPTSRHARA